VAIRLGTRKYIYIYCPEPGLTTVPRKSLYVKLYIKKPISNIQVRVVNVGISIGWMEYLCKHKQMHLTCENHQPNVNEAPKAQPRNVRSKALIWFLVNKATALLGRVAKVVPNSGVGIGVPLTVTVGALFAGEGGVTEGVVSAARIENVLEIEYICPMVELIKRRK